MQCQPRRVDAERMGNQDPDVEGRGTLPASGREGRVELGGKPSTEFAEPRIDGDGHVPSAARRLAW